MSTHTLAPTRELITELGRLDDGARAANPFLNAPGPRTRAGGGR